MATVAPVTGIIFLDTGTKCGAAWRFDSGLCAETWHLDKMPGLESIPEAHARRRYFWEPLINGPRRQHCREWFLYTHLEYLAKEFRAQGHAVTAIYHERVHRHEGTDAAHVYGALVGMARYFADVNAIPIYGVPVQDIKEHATGYRSASKTQMITAAKLQWPGVDFSDDNAADAAWGLALASKAGPMYHGGTKAQQVRAAEKALEARAVGGTRKPKK